MPTSVVRTAEASALRLGGLTPLSLTDYPGQLSAVLFCQGCSWSCAYCHNTHLLDAGATPALDWAAAQDFLRRRKGLLDAVVFSGGEPTLQDGLADAMRRTRDLGFKVGLHTAGAYPRRFGPLLPLADWVGFDVKAPFARYDALTGVPGSGAAARESLSLLLSSGVDCECRTTVHPSLFTAAELAALSASLFALGARRHVLQIFRADGCVDAALNAATGACAELIAQAAALEPRVERRG